MIIKEYMANDTCDRKRLYVDVKCNCCGIIFKRQKRQLNLHSCSIQCSSILKGETVYVECAHCGGTILRSKSKLANSKSGLYFCNRECKEEGQKYILEIMPDHYGSGTGINNYRKLAFDNFVKKCNRCNYNKHIAALVVHHKDRNRNNNKLDNLEVLCANCHAIEHWA